MNPIEFLAPQRPDAANELKNLNENIKNLTRAVEDSGPDKRT
jgi:hypothetical protein